MLIFSLRFCSLFFPWPWHDRPWEAAFDGGRPVQWKADLKSMVLFWHVQTFRRHVCGVLTAGCLDWDRALCGMPTPSVLHFSLRGTREIRNPDTKIIQNPWTASIWSIWTWWHLFQHVHSETVRLFSSLAGEVRPIPAGADRSSWRSLRSKAKSQSCTQKMRWTIAVVISSPSEM